MVATTLQSARLSYLVEMLKGVETANVHVPIAQLDRAHDLVAQWIAQAVPIRKVYRFKSCLGQDFNKRCYGIWENSHNSSGCIAGL